MQNADGTTRIEGVKHGQRQGRGVLATGSRQDEGLEALKRLRPRERRLAVCEVIEREARDRREVALRAEPPFETHGRKLEARAR